MKLLDQSILSIIIQYRQLSSLSYEITKHKNNVNNNQSIEKILIIPIQPRKVLKEAYKQRYFSFNRQNIRNNKKLNNKVIFSPCSRNEKLFPGREGSENDNELTQMRRAERITTSVPSDLRYSPLTGDYFQLFVSEQTRFTDTLPTNYTIWVPFEFFMLYLPIRIVVAFSQIFIMPTLFSRKQELS